MYYLLKYSILLVTILVFMLNFYFAIIKAELFLVLNNIPMWFFFETFYLDKYALFRD